MTNITIQSVQDTLVVDSRLVAAELGILHKNFKELIKSYRVDFEEFGHLSAQSAGVKGTSGYAEFYYLNENQAYLSLTYSNNTPQARRAKINLVKAFDEARNAIQSKLPGNYKEALLALVAAEDEKERLLLEAAELRPKAEDWDSLCSYKNLMTIEKVAKTLAIKGLGEIKLFEWLRDQRILYLDNSKKNVPYQRFVELGYFTTRLKENPYNGKTYVVTLATVKGFGFIKRQLLKNGYVLPPVANEAALALPYEIAA
jgi:phage antirepressor YoqD-like protein